jgi:hypothetical protein
MSDEPTLFEARTTDPETSHAAARALDHTLKSAHTYVLSWVRAYGPATDDHIAEAVVACGKFERHEQARRVIRTLRERHGLLEPVVDDDGQPVTATNSSGRAAILYRAV